MGDPVDTFMNVVALAFIGLLVWLYFKPVETDKRRSDDD